MVFGFMKKKPAKRKATKKKAAKKVAKRKGPKKAFGGYAINFKGRTETLEQVFGNKPIGPSEMTKRIWKFVKSRKLAGKS